jgi:hypothetical protein
VRGNRARACVAKWPRGARGRARSGANSRRRSVPRGARGKNPPNKWQRGAPSTWPIRRAWWTARAEANGAFERRPGVFTALFDRSTARTRRSETNPSPISPSRSFVQHGRAFRRVPVPGSGSRRQHDASKRPTAGVK